MSPGGSVPDLVLASDLARTRQALQPVLELTTAIAAETIAGAAGAGISMIEEGSRTSTASTNPLVELADDRQYDLGEGPCLTAWRDGVMTRADDLATESRWPNWTAAGRELGLRSVLSTPVTFGNRHIGAIKVYSGRARAFDRSAEGLLLKLADQAAIMIENLRSLAATERSSGVVMAALRDRQQIALAQGLLMGRHELTSEQAFLRLVDDAARSGRTVVDESADVTSNR